MKVIYQGKEVGVFEGATFEVVNGDLVITPKEIEFKDGDICFSDNSRTKMIFILEYMNWGNKINYHACLSSYGIEYRDWLDSNGHIRLATEEEKHKLLDALHKDGKDWDAENKKIVDYRWRAKNGEYYWYINSTLSIEYVYEQNILLDNARYNCGNYFFKKEDAEQALEKIKKALNPIK